MCPCPYVQRFSTNELMNEIGWLVLLVNSFCPCCFFCGVRSIDRMIENYNLYTFECTKRMSEGKNWNKIGLYASAVVHCILISRYYMCRACQCRVSVGVCAKYCTVSTFILSQTRNKLTLKLKVHLVSFTHSLNYVTFYALINERRTKEEKHRSRRGAIICTLVNYGNRIKEACAEHKCTWMNGKEQYVELFPLSGQLGSVCTPQEAQTKKTFRMEIERYIIALKFTL